MLYNADYLCFYFSQSLFGWTGKIFFVSAQYVVSWSVGIQDQFCLLIHTWKFPFEGSTDFCQKCVRPTQTSTKIQTCTQDTCSYVASNYWARQHYGIQDVSQ